MNIVGAGSDGSRLSAYGVFHENTQNPNSADRRQHAIAQMNCSGDVIRL